MGPDYNVAPVDMAPRRKIDLDATTDTDVLPAKYSEVNIAFAFAERHHDDMRYVAEWGKWMIWDGQRWRRDRDLSAFDRATRLCCEVAEFAKRDPTEFSTENQRRATVSRYGEKRTIVNVAEVAKADRKIAAVPEQWDADSWLLNTPAGVVDLRTGRLHPQRRDAYQTKITAASPGGSCPTWRAFLESATAGDRDMQAFLQRVAGYCLTGDVREHALFFVYGTGGNGKGTFINTLLRILGDYAQSAPADMFTERKHDSHPTELAGLQGARLVAAQETEEGKRWAEARIKALTGGDKIRARFMRQDDFEFMPQFKLLIAGNHKPGLRNVDEAINRRLHLIPFEVTPPVKDKLLPDKLAAESDGILDWAIEGCLQWLATGLAPPERVLAATADYLEQQDVLAAWIEECLDLVLGYNVTRGNLYKSFKDWAEGAGEYVLPQKRWIAAMESKGYKARVLRGSPVIDGLRLK
jgi:putative DNA primase/helicase